VNYKVHYILSCFMPLLGGNNPTFYRSGGGWATMSYLLLYPLRDLYDQWGPTSR
jgi:hypothetical protein